MNARGAQHLITLHPGFKKEKGQNFGWVILAGRGQLFSYVTENLIQSANFAPLPGALQPSCGRMGHWVGTGRWLHTLAPMGRLLGQRPLFRKQKSLRDWNPSTKWSISACGIASQT